MKDILLSHSRRYPEMEPRDAVKLVYQRVFGGGHMIRDTESCLAFLRREYAATAQRSDLPLLEDIGGGMFRVQLAALDSHGYLPEALGRDFIRSASLVRGDLQTFQEILTQLHFLTDAGKMPFSSDALDRYLEDYARAGYPPVSHSEAYRQAYHPAYRVVDSRCLPAEVRSAAASQTDF